MTDGRRRGAHGCGPDYEKSALRLHLIEILVFKANNTRASVVMSSRPKPFFLTATQAEKRQNLGRLG
jgi:hypothetical protein